MMNFSPQRLAVIWCAAILVVSAGAVMAGASITFGNGILALVAGAVPAAIMLTIWRPAPPTVAQLLYDANSARDDQR